MSLIEEMELPDISLLYRYQIEGAYTDCYVTDIPGDISQAEYVEAFYTTPLFKLERWILSWLAFRPSTDEEANALALAKRDKFAAWDVEERNSNQLLMCDFQGSTRSWLMSEPVRAESPPVSTSVPPWWGKRINIPGKNAWELSTAC
jgi:hypothetical protein